MNLNIEKMCKGELLLFADAKSVHFLNMELSLAVTQGKQIYD